jgi:Rod binding domain-containing protein
MDSTNMILTEPVRPPLPLEGMPKSDIENASDDKKKQIARDFESVLLTRLMDQMKETVGDWGFEEDGASSQVQGIFWLYLAQDVANNGGMGLWKDIYQFMAAPHQADATGKSLDGSL